MKTKVSITCITHKNEKRIGLAFPYNLSLISLARKVKGYQYSSSLKLFHYPNKKETMQQLQEAFKDFAEIKIEGDFSHPQGSMAEWNTREPSPEAQQKMKQYKEWMRSKRYSESTIGTYMDALKAFLKFYNTKALTEISNDDLIKYNNDFILKHRLSASYQNQLVNAVKLFFKIVSDKKIDVDIIHRPKRPKLLPNVLSKEEVKLILTAQANIKHRAMLGLIYSCGLRRGELIKLKLTDIDSKRNLLIVRQAKGRKDRIVPLSQKTIELLRSYFVAYKPKAWLFEGQDKRGAYDEKSLASVLKQAVEKAKISKPVTLHWLRHSYATHLLENGTDLRYIQEILGHASSRTTEIYTHVSNKSIQNVVSPFDSL